MSRLLLIEGIPGSGKSSTTVKLAGLLAARGARVQSYLEGDPQPADLAWAWWLGNQQFQAICEAHPEAAAELRHCAWVGDTGTAVAYTKVDRDRAGPEWAELSRELAATEPFNGALPPEEFVTLHARRWAELGATERDRPGFVLMETALLQNPIGELLLFAQWSPAQIAGALNRILAGVAELSPTLVVLRTQDVAATVSAVASQRVDQDGNQWWFRAAQEFVAGTPWAQARGLGATAGLVSYLESRVALEDQITGSLDLPRVTLPRITVPRITVRSPAGSGGSWAGFDGELESLATALCQELDLGEATTGATGSAKALRGGPQQEHH